MIYGDQDQFTTVQKYEQWIPPLKRTAKGQISTHMIHNADHFWKGPGGEQLCLVISQWLDKVTP